MSNLRRKGYLHILRVGMHSIVLCTNTRKTNGFLLRILKSLLSFFLVFSYLHEFQQIVLE